MANFEDGSYSCKPGIDLIAKVLAGKCQMKYTKATVGSGTLGPEENPKDQTEVKGYVMDAQISAVTTPQNGECQVTIQVNSADVENGFYATGILLYARGESGEDVPYTYLVLENEPEWIRPKTSDIGKLATFDLVVAVGGVDKVSAVIDTDSIMTRQASESLLDDMMGRPEDYSPDAPYAVGDTATHEGQAYRCTTAITKGEAWNPGHWEKVDLYGEVGTLQAESKTAAEDIDQLQAASDRLYKGVNLADKFADEISKASGTTDEQKRWNWIKGRIDKHDWTGLHVGDYLKLKVKAVKDVDGANAGTEQVEEHEMQIAGIDTCYNTGGDETHGTNSTTGLVPIPHHIDFISRDLLNTPVQWNLASQNYNSGTGDGKQDDATDQPYLCSHVNSYLTEKVLPTIDAEVSKLFTDKAQILERRAKAEQPLTDSTSHHWYRLGKLWLPTEYEVYGTGVFGTLPWSATQVAQYPIFAGSGTTRIKNIGPGGTRGGWWLACAMGGSSTAACIVAHGGGAASHVVTDTGVRVPVCFRIAGTA